MSKIEQIRVRFHKALKLKTSWGRDELKKTLDEIILNVVLGEETE